MLVEEFYAWAEGIDLPTAHAQLVSFSPGVGRPVDHVEVDRERAGFFNVRPMYQHPDGMFYPTEWEMPAARILQFCTVHNLTVKEK